MRRLIGLAAILATLPFVLGADISDALLSSMITLSNVSGSTQTDAVFAIPLSTQGLIDTGQIASDGLNMEMCNTDIDCDPATNEIPFGPGPVRTDLLFHERFDTTGSTFTSELTDASSAAVNDVAFFDADPETGDINYYGFDVPSRILRLTIGTIGIGDWTLAWQYWNGSAWTALSGVEDGTLGYMRGGHNSVHFDMPVDWAANAVDGDTAFWIRANMTFTSSSVSPLGTQAWYEHGVTYAYLPSINNGTQETTKLYTGGADMRTLHAYFPGDAGITLTNFTTLGGPQTIEIVGSFVPEATGAARFLVDIQGVTGDGIFVSWDSAVDGAIDVTTVGLASNCALSNIPTGITDGSLHTLEIEFDGVTTSTCYVLVDNVQVGGTDAYVGFWSVGTSTNIFLADGSVNWIQSFKIAKNSLDPDTNTQLHYEILDTSTFLGDTIVDIALAFDGAPSFPYPPTTGLNVSLGPFTSISTTADATTTFVDPSFIPDVAADGVAFTGTPNPGVNLPLGDTISGILGPANVPTAFFWHLILATVVILAIMGVSILTGGNYIAGMLAGGIVLMLAMSPGVGLVNVWILFFYVVFCVGIIVLARGRDAGI